MLLLLLACAPVGVPTEALVVDEAGVQEALDLTAPSVAMDLLDNLLTELPNCDPASFEDGQGLRETWTCPPTPGTVDRYEDEELVWMEASGLLLDDFRMDGAIELVIEDSVSTLEMAATICGEGWSDCDEPVQTDLTWTLIESEPLLEVLVTGTLVTPDLGPTLVEGSLVLDDACDQPLEGLLLLEGSKVQAFRYQDCDCADWSVDGDPIGSFCR